MLRQLNAILKLPLKQKKPKSWLKSVSAFANGVGGRLFFGVDDNKNIVGLSDIQNDAELISRLIKERITPFPNFILTPELEDGRYVLVLTVISGRTPPYYYKADGVMEAYIRIGNESVTAPSYVVNQLILQGMNRSYDSLESAYKFKDFAFSKLRERYKVWTGNSFEDKYFDSFEIRDANGLLTNAGALLADDSPIRQSRLFCVRWNGLDKSGGKVDALDSAEYSGSLITLLNDGIGFIKRNMRVQWKKAADSRIEMPDYCERSFFEALVNALVHRDYLILGSEVHIDIFDDRLTIYSPGGMLDGTLIQDCNLSNVPSARRNPVIADIFNRLGYMERQGSGLNKINAAYERAANFHAGLEPVFYSDNIQFKVTLKNLNYFALDSEKQALNSEKTGVGLEKQALDSEKQALNSEKTGVGLEKQALDSEETGVGLEKQVLNYEKVITEQERQSLDLNKLIKSRVTIQNVKTLYKCFGLDKTFSRADVKEVCNITDSPSGELLRKLKVLQLVEVAPEHGRGKYRFVKHLN